MNRRIIDELIAAKTKVTVMMNVDYFNGFNNAGYSGTGTIKRSDDLGILFESKEKKYFFYSVHKHYRTRG